MRIVARTRRRTALGALAQDVDDGVAGAQASEATRKTLTKMCQGSLNWRAEWTL
jgi:hypothetical protein